MDKVVTMEYRWYRAETENSKLTGANQCSIEGTEIQGDHSASQGSCY